MFETNTLYQRAFRYTLKSNLEGNEFNSKKEIILSLLLVGDVDRKSTCIDIIHYVANFNNALQWKRHMTDDKRAPK